MITIFWILAMEVPIKILLFCFSCNMPFLPNSCSFSLILLINLCRALRRIIKEWGITIFRTNLYVESYFYGYSCVLLDSEYVLHFVSSLINFRAFSASKFVLCQFLSKSLECQELLFFSKENKFPKSSCFFHIQKIIFVFEIVHCAVCLLWWSIYSGKGEGTLLESRVHFNPLISMLQIISFPFL